MEPSSRSRRFLFYEKCVISLDYCHWIMRRPNILRASIMIPIENVYCLSMMRRSLVESKPSYVYQPGDWKLYKDMDSSSWNRSGKMMVLKSILNLWFKENHKVLIYTQTVQMLTILESFIKEMVYQISLFKYIELFLFDHGWNNTCRHKTISYWWIQFGSFVVCLPAHHKSRRHWHLSTRSRSSAYLWSWLESFEWYSGMLWKSTKKGIGLWAMLENWATQSCDHLSSDYSRNHWRESVSPPDLQVAIKWTDFGWYK